MNKFTHTIALLFIFSLFFTKNIAQNNNQTAKLVNLQRDYITENKDEAIPPFNQQTVLYWVNQGGYSIYFHSNGITFKQRKTKKDDSSEETNNTYRSWAIKFDNGNTNNITAQNKLPHYSCIYKKEKGKIININNSNYKSILYQNVWPNIDIKFYIKKNKQGLKYDIILRPGANEKDFTFKYDNATIKTNEKGELIINTPFGIFNDQAPISININNNEEVPSKFNPTNNNLLNINIGKHNIDDTIIIDPWITSPLSYGDWAKDIDYDFDGNTYVLLTNSWVGQDINFGPTILQHTIDYEVAKYNSAGVLQWSLFFYERWPGDLTVSKTSSEIYVSNLGTFSSSTPNPNDALYRIDNTGAILNIYSMVSSDNNEFITLKYDGCNNELIVGAGGTKVFSPFNVGTANATLSSYNTLHLCGSSGLATQDVCNMALDPDGSSAYFLVGESSFYSHDPNCNQKIFKVPLGGLTPTTWSAPTTYSFTENARNNGMVCGNQFLYSYDGSTLSQWNKLNGTLINSVVTGGVKFVSGGIDIESCSDYIYVGAGNSIKVYDVGLNLITTYNLPGKCADLVLNQNGKLFVSGENFVSEVDISSPFTMTSTSDTCNLCLGTATIDGCFSNSSEFLWSPSGQTSKTAVNLCQGWHKVTVTDAGTCNNSYDFSQVDSVFVNNEYLSIDCEELIVVEPIIFELLIPNTFSPNKDNKNEQFTITLNGDIINKGGVLNIFNRWGVIIFTSTDDMIWDGGESSTGVYYYTFEYDNKSYSGNITLFR